MKLNKWWPLGLIFILALFLRFYGFTGNVYFGFDEARDAFVSQAIYTQGDWKIIGPPANAPGLNHGVLHWYLMGILYIVGLGNPFFVAAVFRIINALAIFPIFWITDKLFGKRAAYIASAIFAVSFEATQYSMYYGNPSLAIFSWISLFAGAVVIYKNKNKFWGLPLMALGIASGAQLELFLVTLFIVGIVILLILFKNLKKISIKSWILAIVVGLGIDSPYILTEIRSNFNGVKTALNLATGGYSVSGDASKWIIYEKRWIKLFHDNFFPADSRVLWVIASVFLLFWIYQALKKVEYRLLLTWIFGGVAIFIFGAYSAYYINVGIGTGLIIGLAAFADKAIDQSKYVGFAVILLALAGNIYQIRALNKDGLIEDIKTQQFMFLADEIKIINKMYSLADNKSFTMRITSMPYNMQTVWAYLIDQYGKPVHGYSPYYETGNVLGFPGYIPQPTSGVTCVRFLIREPIGGIPKHLIEKDEKDEDEFSKIEDTFEFGYFLLEKRISLDSRCLTENFPK